MSTSEFDPKLFELFNAMRAVVFAARMVTAFDGTDRESLDKLRDALYEFGRIDQELHEK